MRGRRKWLGVLVATAMALPISAQYLSPEMNTLLRAQEAYQLQSYVGVLRELTPEHRETWRLPGQDEEARYLDGIARGALNTADADLRLLKFIEDYPHSAYLPYATARLGEVYYIRGNFSSAVYWFAKTDTSLLPEEMAMAVDYYLGYSYMREGNDAMALRLLNPLTITEAYGDAAAFYTGYIYMKQGDLERGVALLSRVQNHPTYDLYANAYIAEALLSQVRYSEAKARSVSVLNRLGQLSKPVELSALRVAGLASANLGEVEQSVRYLGEYMRLADSPGRVEQLTLGKGLFDLGQPVDAVRYLNAVSDGGERDFMSQLALYYAGLSLLSLGQTGAALRSFDRSVEVGSYAPLSEVAAYNAALVEYSATQGRVGAGSQRLTQFYRRYPQSEYRASVVQHLSEAFLNEPNGETALRAMEELPEPLPADLKRVRERVRLGQANRALSSGETASARRQYDEIIQRGDDPVSVAEAYLWRGEAAYRAGDYAGAIQSTEAYLRQRPEQLALNPNAYLTLGYAYFNTKRYPEAKRQFETFLQNNSAATADECSDVYNRLGDIAVQGRSYSEAERYYQQAVQAGGTSADQAHFSRAMMLGMQRDYSGKAALLAQLPRLYPSSKLIPEALYEQGNSLGLIQDNAGARAAYERFLGAYRQHELAPKVGVQLALTYFNDNRLEEAASIYEDVVRRYPKTPEAMSALQDLKSISVQLNRVAQYNDLINQVGAGHLVGQAEMDSLAFIAAERVVAEGTAQEASKALQDYLRNYPNGIFVDRAIYNQGLLLYNNKQYREAADKVAPLVPRVSGRLAKDLHNLMASAYDRAGEPGRAAEAFLRLARVEEGQRERSQAVRGAVERAVRSESHDFILSLANELLSGNLVVNEEAQADTYAAATEVYAKSNQKGQAVRFAQMVLQLPNYGKHAMADVVVALDLYDKGDYTTAQKRMQQLTQRGSTDAYWLARAFILLADTYTKQGDKETARAYLEGLKGSYENRTDGIIKLVDDRLSAL